MIREAGFSDLHDVMILTRQLSNNTANLGIMILGARAVARKAKGITTLVYEKDKKIVGTVSYLIYPRFTGGDACHLEDLVVDIDHRNNGIGRELVEYVIKQAKESGCYKVILSCKPDVKGFYEKLGFMSVEDQMRIDL